MQGPGLREAALEANRTFRTWLDHALTLDDTARAAEEEEGERLAFVRRPLLAQLLLEDPELALAMAVAPGERASVSASIAAHLEVWRDGIGALDVIEALGNDPEFTPFPVERFVRFETAGEVLRAGVFGRRADQMSRASLPLHGVALDGNIALTEHPLRRLFPGENPGLTRTLSPDCAGQGLPYHAGSQVILFCSVVQAVAYDTNLAAQEAEPAAAADPWTKGVKKVLFMRVDFSDKPGDPLSQASAESLINSTVNSFYDANSFHQTSVSTTVTPTLRLPKTQADYKASNNYTGLLLDARTAALAAGFDTSQYQFDLAAFVPTFSGWSGLGYVGAKGSWINGAFNLRVVAHELGHNFGLNHANSWSAGATSIGTGANQEYGNPFDVMGSGGALGSHFQARYKRNLDWLAGSGVATVTSSGTFRVNALEEVSSAGLQALKIVRDSKKDYWVEFRNALNNVFLKSGASINWGYAGNTAGHLLDMTPGDGTVSNSALTVGRTFSDPLAGIHVTPIALGGTTPQSLDVVVNLGAFASNHSPSVSLGASTLSTAPDASVTFTANASDDDGDTLVYAWELDDGSVVQNTAVVQARFGAARDYSVRCTVSDMKGGTATDSVVLTVGTPATFTLSGLVLSSGSGVQGARISDGTRATTTDSQGRYALTNVPTGSFTLTAAKADYTFARNFVTPIAVSANASGLDFTATPVAGYQVRGSVTAGGQALQSVQISDGSRIATSGASGAYVLNPVPTGRYTLSASLPGWDLRPSGFSNPTDVMGGNVTGINFAAAGAWLQGSVPATVPTAPSITDGVRTVVATREGANPWMFFLSTIPDGTWNIVATAPGFTLTPANFTNPIVVSGGIAPTRLNFQVASGTTYTVQGRVSSGGLPLAGVIVGDGTRTSTTDGLGRFVLVGVPSGSYTLTPQLVPNTFTPSSRPITISNGNLTGQDFSTTTVVSPPTVATPASATVNSVTGRTATATVLGSDAAGEANLSYTWTASGPFPVTFSANGTNAAKNTTATFSGIGSYTLQVTIANQAGLSARSSAGVYVAPVWTSLDISPSNVEVVTDGTQIFEAVLSDQFGGSADWLSVKWEVSGGGTLSAVTDGGTAGGGEPGGRASTRFTAGSTPGGPFLLTGQAQGKTGTAQITVVGSGAPTISTPLAVTPSPVVGTTAALSVRATDNGGDETLIYEWTAPLAPKPVIFSANASNGAKDCVATFAQAGNYEVMVTVSDTAGNKITRLISIVVEATPSQIDVQPLGVKLVPLASQLYVGTVIDQFGNAPSPQPPLVWTTSGGGTISAEGVFAAGASAGGPFTITATLSTLSGSADVTIEAAPDTEAPVVSLASPQAGTHLDGGFAFAAQASDNVGVVRVEFFVDGSTKLGEATATPFEARGDASGLTPGSHILTARASDAAGNVAVSQGVSVIVDAPVVRDTTPPTVSIATPLAGSTTGLKVTFTAIAADDVGVAQVSWELDGAEISLSRAAPWSASATVSEGEHVVIATATDAAGNSKRSAAVSFFANGSEDAGSGSGSEDAGSGSGSEDAGSGSGSQDGGGEGAGGEADAGSQTEGAGTAEEAVTNPPIETISGGCGCQGGAGAPSALGFLLLLALRRRQAL